MFVSHSIGNGCWNSQSPRISRQAILPMSGKYLCQIFLLKFNQLSNYFYSIGMLCIFSPHINACVRDLNFPYVIFFKACSSRSISLILVNETDQRIVLLIISPNVMWGTQEMLWPVNTNIQKASERVEQLATPKKDFSTTDSRGRCVKSNFLSLVSKYLCIPKFIFFHI